MQFNLHIDLIDKMDKYLKENEVYFTRVPLNKDNTIYHYEVSSARIIHYEVSSARIITSKIYCSNKAIENQIEELETYRELVINL